MARVRESEIRKFYFILYTALLGTGILFRNMILSAVKDLRFVSDRISHSILKDRHYDLRITNMHSTTEDKDDEVKDEFYNKLEIVFDKLSPYRMKIVLGDFNEKWDVKISLDQQ